MDKLVKNATANLYGIGSLKTKSELNCRHYIEDKPIFNVKKTRLDFSICFTPKAHYVAAISSIVSSTTPTYLMENITFVS